ncbi:pirin family protein [Archangium gephyra]|nr:pirin family protein [Archangium gephyra]
MEIAMYVLSGQTEHRDSMGTLGVLPAPLHGPDARVQADQEPRRGRRVGGHREPE